MDSILSTVPLSIVTSLEQTLKSRQKVEIFLIILKFKTTACEQPGAMAMIGNRTLLEILDFFDKVSSLK